MADSFQRNTVGKRYKRKPVESYPLRKCAICPKETRARQPSKIYCSNACRQEAARRRKGTSVRVGRETTVVGSAAPEKSGTP